MTIFKNEFPKSRLEALSDGIFAIVMTIIVLALEVPDGLGDELPSHEFFVFLVNIFPQIETYIISFILTGVFWLRHQLQFDYIVSVNRALISLNLFFLLFVTFIPFTTGFVMKYPDAELPFLVYAGNLIVISLLLVLLWRVASKDKKLIDKNTSDEEIHIFGRMTIIAPVIFLMCILISFVSIRTAMFILYLEPLYYFFSRQVIKSKQA